MQVYADYAAATPLDTTVKAAMEPYLIDSFYNPSAVYLKAESVRKDIEFARDRIAKILRCKPSEIIFTAGATESCNLAVKGIMNSHPDKKLVISAIEHSAVSKPAQQHKVAMVEVDKHGVVDLKSLEQMIDDDVVLVSIIYANNEIGVVQPIRKIVALIDTVRSVRQKSGKTTPLYLHVDAAQAPNYINIDVNRLGVDMMSLNAAKIYGPKQVGLLYVRTGIELTAQIEGGGQENNVRSGTENVAGLMGFAEAISRASSSRSDESERLSRIKAKFIDLLDCKKNEIMLNSTAKKLMPNIINISVVGLDGERIVMELDERGIMCATGAACSANSGGGSPTLAAVGRSQAEVDGSVRFSFGRSTEESHVEYVAENLLQVIAKLRGMK